MNDLMRYLIIVCLYGVTAILQGCVNPVMSRVSETMATQSPVQLPPAAKVAPEIKSNVLPVDISTTKKFSLTVRNAEIDSVLLMLSRESGVPIIAECGITGYVSVTFEKKSLGEALYAVIKPLGYAATVDNGIIIVGRPKLTSHTFQVNYIKEKRETRSTTNINTFTTNSTDSGRSSGSSNSSGGNSGNGNGNVYVTTSGTTDVWGSLESALEMLVFGSSGSGRRDTSGFVRGEPEKKDSAGLKRTDSKPGSAHDPQKAGGNWGEGTESLLDEVISTRMAEGRQKKLVVNEVAGIIYVTDYPENIEKIGKFLEDIERAIKRQVLIQAHIVEVTLRDAFSLGIDWNLVAGSLSVSQSLTPLLLGSRVFNLSASGDHFSTMVNAMKEQGQVKMLSSPKVIAMNNQKAIIKLTTKEVSWTTVTTPGQNNTNPVTDTVAQIDEVGIFLDVTPQIDETGRITMQVHPSVSEVKRYSTSPDGKSTKPVIDVREIDTMVDTKSGDTIVIAGLIADKLHETKISVPLMGDLPYVGPFFSYNQQSREKTELVIFLTPFYLNLASIEEIRKQHEKRLSDLGEVHIINNLGRLVTNE